MHASTFLALLILNESNSSPLSSTTFLVVWVLSVGLTTLLGGRWKAVALLFAGMMGGYVLLSYLTAMHSSYFIQHNIVSCLKCDHSPIALLAYCTSICNYAVGHARSPYHLPCPVSGTSQCRALYSAHGYILHRSVFHDYGRRPSDSVRGFPVVGERVG